MKKVISIALALVMLCLGVVVFADDATPSKTTEDLLTIEAVPATPVEGSGFFFFPVTEKYVDVTIRLTSISLLLSSLRSRRTARKRTSAKRPQLPLRQSSALTK